MNLWHKLYYLVNLSVVLNSTVKKKVFEHLEPTGSFDLDRFVVKQKDFCKEKKLNNVEFAMNLSYTTLQIYTRN